MPRASLRCMESTAVGVTGRASVASALDEVPLGSFHRRAIIVSGVGFFTDAYDLFVIGTALVLLKSLWHLSTTQVSLVGSSTLLGAFVGAFVFGRAADVFGRRVVYGLVAAIMVVGAVASAAADGLVWLVAARFVLGVGIGGDYPVSAVLASEYANRQDRGRMVGLVFSMQAVGLIVGPLVGMALIGSGLGAEVSWRVMLGVGALPALGVLYMRAKMPESPRFTENVLGQRAQALRDASGAGGPARQASVQAPGLAATLRPGVRFGGIGHRHIGGPWRSVPRRRLIGLVAGTAGSWFLLDYAYYGNTISTPLVMKDVAPHASLVANLAWTLVIFVVFAFPGYVLAVWRMDRIGHRRLQLLGFAAMAATLALLASWPAITASLAPFVALYGLSYFFTEFGPNVTTFVLPSEVFPTALRASGHGVAAGVGKLGAFVGVFVFPMLNSAFGLRGSLAVAAVAALGGIAVTLLLPEPARRSLEEVSGESAGLAAAAA